LLKFNLRRCQLGGCSSVCLYVRACVRACGLYFQEIIVFCGLLAPYMFLVSLIFKISMQYFLQSRSGGARKHRVDRGSVPVPVGSMGTAGADRSAAEIAAEL
jgi:hypothetical protein